MVRLRTSINWILDFPLIYSKKKGLQVPVQGWGWVKIMVNLMVDLQETTVDF